MARAGIATEGSLACRAGGGKNCKNCNKHRFPLNHFPHSPEKPRGRPYTPAPAWPILASHHAREPVHNRPPSRPSRGHPARASRDRAVGPARRDRDVDRDIARIPHRRHQPLPARLERLRGDDGRTARDDARRALLGRHARLGRLGAAPRQALRAPRHLPDPSRRVRLGERRRPALRARLGAERSARRVAPRRRAVRADAPLRRPHAGILSVGEPYTGLRPSDEELEVLVAVADHVALALESFQEAAAAAHHRVALRELLQVSSRLAETPSVEAILQADCDGITARARVPEGGGPGPRPAERGLRHARDDRVDARRAGPERAALDVGAGAAPRPAVRDPGLLPAHPRAGDVAPACGPPHVPVGHERPRPVGLGPPLARRAAPRPRRQGHRRDLGGRPRRPARSRRGS